MVAGWNGSALIERCLVSVLSSHHPRVEVVVVDNASSDGTADLVARRFPSALLLRNERNLGFAAACNRGIAAAQGSVLALLNQDAIADPEWIPELLSALRSPGVAIAGSRCLYPDGRIQSAGGSVEWPLAVARARGTGQDDGPNWDQPCEVDYVSGCGMAFRRGVFDAVGGFEESFWPGYYEDVDFCLRARRRQFSSWYAPRARLTHDEGGSFRHWTDRWRYHHRGRIHVALTHRPTRFLDDFMPAERLFMPAIRATCGGRLLARAYREVLVRSVVRRERQGHLDRRQAAGLANGLRGLAQLALEGTTATPDGARAKAQALQTALTQSQLHLMDALRFERRRQMNLESELREQERFLASEVERRHSCESEVSSLRSVVSERERELASEKRVRIAREEELASEKQVRSAREEQLASVEAALAERDRELASEKQVRSARDEQLASVGAVLAERDRELASVKAVREAREKELESYRVTLPAREEELRNLKALAEAERERLAAVHEELSTVAEQLARVRATLPGRLAERWSRRRRQP